VTTRPRSERFDDGVLQLTSAEGQPEEGPTERAEVRYRFVRQPREEPTQAAQISVELRKGRRAEVRVPAGDAVQMLDVAVYATAAAAIAASPTLTIQWLVDLLHGWEIVSIITIQMILVGGLATMILRRRRR
jgi:hypothetical protein